MNSIEKGLRGEAIVQEYLREKGYRILERNYRFRHREVDIIAGKEELVAFVEVKMRSEDDFGRGFEAVSEMKKRNIISVARHYIQRHNLYDCNVRFDIASLDGGVLHYFENAYGV
jgi:putative endonuclease